ncbi:hypothetical protein RA210_U550004 [Rubrivivax sp. A210]|nr:hypothetical protein RA210_U550004 [Rubrivivax sp. A210]
MPGAAFLAGNDAEHHAPQMTALRAQRLGAFEQQDEFPSARLNVRANRPAEVGRLGPG